MLCRSDDSAPQDYGNEQSTGLVAPGTVTEVFICFPRLPLSHLSNGGHVLGGTGERTLPGIPKAIVKRETISTTTGSAPSRHHMVIELDAASVFVRGKRKFFSFFFFLRRIHVRLTQIPQWLNAGVSLTHQRISARKCCVVLMCVARRCSPRAKCAGPRSLQCYHAEHGCRMHRCSGEMSDQPAANMCHRP